MGANEKINTICIHVYIWYDVRIYHMKTMLNFFFLFLFDKIATNLSVVEMIFIINLYTENVMECFGGNLYK